MILTEGLIFGCGRFYACDFADSFSHGKRAAFEFSRREFMAVSDNQVGVPGYGIDADSAERHDQGLRFGDVIAQHVGGGDTTVEAEVEICVGEGGVKKHRHEEVVFAGDGGGE